MNPIQLLHLRMITGPLKDPAKNLPAMPVPICNPQLRLLNALRAGSKPMMTFLGLPSFRTAQMVAQTGLDVGGQ